VQHVHGLDDVAAGACVVGRACLLPRPLHVVRYHCVDDRVPLLDALELCVEQLDAADHAVAQRGDHLRRGAGVEIDAHHPSACVSAWSSPFELIAVSLL